MTTTKQNYTPGPWKIEQSVSQKGFSHLAITNRNSPDWFVCSVSPMNLRRPIDFANAALIAAAPELFAALQRLLRALESDVSQVPNQDIQTCWESNSLAIASARAALNNARLPLP